MSTDISTSGRLPALDDAPDVLTEAQVRAIFQIPRSSLSISIRRGEFPKPFKISSAGKRWLKSALVAFVNRQTGGGGDVE